MRKTSTSKRENGRWSSSPPDRSSLDGSRGEILIEGDFYKRVARGRKVYRSIISVRVDGKLVYNLGVRSKRGSNGTESIKFKRSVIILARSGPSGLEGSKPDGGKWVRLMLIPSSSRRGLRITMPVDSEKAVLTITGTFDVADVSFCSTCDPNMLSLFAINS